MTPHIRSGMEIYDGRHHWDVPKHYPDGFVVTTETHPPKSPLPEMERPTRRVSRWYETLPEALAGELGSPAGRIVRLFTEDDGWHVVHWTDGRRSYATFITDCAQPLTYKP